MKFKFQFEVIGHSSEDDAKLTTLRALLNDSRFLNISNMHLSRELVKVMFNNVIFIHYLNFKNKPV